MTLHVDTLNKTETETESLCFKFDSAKTVHYKPPKAFLWRLEGKIFTC
jgi:hypothetical protein